MARQTTFWTLADSAGATWYVYPTTDGELGITDTIPQTSEAGQWVSNNYQFEDNDNPTTADSGIIYMTFTDSSSVTWYVYPNTDGELVIDTEEPS